MALPKLETPTYECTIPSTGRVIEYRPFLVKEEKILMMAQESKDASQAINALKKIIKACCFNKIEPNELTTYDAEYLFLQLRIKSVGEKTKFQLPCEKCQVPQDVIVDLSEVEVKFPKEKPETNIRLTDTVGMTLKELTLNDAIGVQSDQLDDISQMVAMVVDTIYDEDNVYKSSDISQKELTEFIDQLNHSQLEKVQQFLVAQPAIEKTVVFGCKEKKEGCEGCKNEVTMRGLADFFA